MRTVRILWVAGAVFGEPAGITVKQYVSEDIAFDVTVNRSSLENDTFYLHIDYLHHIGRLFGKPRM
jgi:hypothetical protein